MVTIGQNDKEQDTPKNRQTDKQQEGFGEGWTNRQSNRKTYGGG